MIVPLKPHHSAAVAQLHLDYLRSSFAGKAGHRLLQANYQNLVTGAGACGFVAESATGQVIGYVCGVWDSRLVRNRLVINYWPQLMFWGIQQMTCKPVLLASLFQRLNPPDTKSQPEPEGYELRPIVVAPPARGTGVALDLIKHLLIDASRRGFRTIFLLTELDNHAANAFYQKAGFRLTEVVVQNKVKYNRYEHPVQEIA